MPEFTITLTQPGEYLAALADAIEAARTPHLAALHGMIADQLPKAPVEEPTEWGSVVRARRSPAVPRTLLTYVPEPDEVRDSPYSWYSDQDSWHIWSDLSDVEVLRVGVGEPATPPAEAVEADKAPSRFIARRLAPDRSLLDSDTPAEPTPEQVEADLAQAEQAHARYYAQAALAPAEGDAIEALVASFVDLIWHGIDNDKIAWHNAARDLAARVLEVGGQQPGVPVEVRSLIRAADRMRDDWAEGNQDRKNELWVALHVAADACRALLPEEPTS